MTETYFSKFPIITYNGVQTRNITERVSIISSENKRIPTQYHPWEIGNEIRPDVLSYAYYKDSGYDWLIYLANGITDPYYDWYMPQDDFYAYLEKKYGSVPAAQETILYYRNNWADDEIGMTVSAFNAQNETIKKYYTPVFGVKASVQSYKRREEDWTASTNQIVTVNFTSEYFSNTETIFTEGSYVNFKSEDGETVGSGQTIFSNTTAISIQHVSGYNDPAEYDAPLILVQAEGPDAAGVVTSSKVDTYVISLAEQVYYSPVTAFDMENEKNESQKFIYLLDSGYALSTSETVRRKLNGIGGV